MVSSPPAIRQYGLPFDHLPAQMLRANLTMRLGINVIDPAKSSERSYSQVREGARRFGPLWRWPLSSTRDSAPRKGDRPPAE